MRQAGECYFREGDHHAQSVYVVERGGVRVHKRWQGGEWALKELGVGDCFGEMALLDLEPRSASVCAVADDTCAIEFGADGRGESGALGRLAGWASDVSQPSQLRA